MAKNRSIAKLANNKSLHRRGGSEFRIKREPVKVLGCGRPVNCSTVMRLHSVRHKLLTIGALVMSADACYAWLLYFVLLHFTVCRIN